MANDMIRMSGMNSGLDTESIINALTANTKLKATKQERNVLKYQATQEAYRDIISKMQNIKNKYFDILNKESYISGSSMWNKYAAKVYNEQGAEALNSGITVSTTVNSNPGEYKITVKNTAKQAKLEGKSISGKSAVDLGSLEENHDYGMTVTVGDVQKIIKFKGGADEDETRGNINEALKEAFGESNQTANAESGEGMVYVDSSGQIVSRSAKGVSMTGIGTMSDSSTLKLANAATGSNTVSFQVGGEVVSASFQTISSSYFQEAVDDGIISAEDGSTRDGDTLINYLKEQDPSLSDTDAQAKSIELMMKHSETVSLYKQVVDDYKESVRYNTYTSWAETGDFDELYNKAEAEHKDSIIGSWIEKSDTFSGVKDAYDFYVQSEKDNGTAEEDIETLYEYALRNRNETWTREDGITDFSALRDEFDALVAKYDGTTETDAELQEAYAKSVITANETANAAYEAYKAQDGNEDVGYYEWTQTSDGAAYASAVDNSTEEYADWKQERIDSNSWKLTKDSWMNSESTKFSAYKKFVYDEEGTDYHLEDTAKIIDHFNESALKNSIGNLTTSDGTKFEVSYNANTDEASIKATKADGSDAAFSMTINKGSANGADVLGGVDASTSISQITNSTKLSDIGAKTDENGQYSFSVNGVDFSFDGETTVNDMMKKVNASSAGVKMSYSSLTNSFTVTASQYGVESKIDMQDSGGGDLLDMLNLTTGTFTAGQNLEIQVGDDPDSIYQSTSNSIDIDGNTFTFSNKMKDGDSYTVNVEKDTSAIKDLIKGFVEDYNKLVEDVYKYLDEKPEKDYYFLTDSDKEDLDLSEKQEEKWEAKSKLGLLYHDNITTSVMSSLRTALMGSVEGLDGNTFSLSSLGIKTMSDYNQHGKFAAIDEDALDKAINNNLDDIQKLFSDSENGIMKKFQSALEAGIGTTGENKGSLIKKAGLSSGSTATNNELYNTIKRTKTRIASLNTRYENEQNRLWKRYSNMESMLGTLNSQQASFSSYFMQ